MKKVIYIIFIFIVNSCSNNGPVKSKNSYQLEFIQESDNFIYLYDEI